MESSWYSSGHLKDVSLEKDLFERDYDTSDDEETLRKEVKILKEYRERGGELAINKDHERDQSDGLSLISFLAAEPSTPHNVLKLSRIIICTLKQMESGVLAKLRQNSIDQEAIFAEINRMKSERYIGTFAGASFRKCGMPFFTWCDKWSQPANAYVRGQEKRGCATPMQHFINVFCWSHKENTELYKLVTRACKEDFLLKLENRVKSLVRCRGDPEELEKAKLQMVLLRGGGAVRVDVEKVDWLRVSVALGKTYSPLECQAQWDSYVSPATNRSRWDKMERDKLLTIAKAHGFQSWDKVAEELGTGRSALMCCITFQRMAVGEVSPWTPDDDAKLKNLMKRFCCTSTRSLPKISYFFENKTPRQVRRRYYMMLNPKRKGRLTQDEESTLFTLSDNFQSDLQVACRGMPDRSWQLLKQKHKKLMREEPNFTCEDDRLLFEAVANHGQDWAVVSEAIPGRVPVDVRQRYHQLINFGQEVLKVAMGTRNGVKLLPSDKDAWTILQLMWERRGESSVGKRYGTPLNGKMSLASQRLLRVLELGNKSLFGPRFHKPKNYEQRYSMACLMAFTSNTLSTTFVPDTAADRLLRHVPSAGRPEDSVLALREIVIPEPLPSSVRCFIPPNVITLMAARVLSSSRGLLMGQAALTSPLPGTIMSQDIPPEDRLLPCRAKRLLKDRVFSLFFLSLFMARISHNPDECEAVVAAERPSEQLPKPKMPNRWKKKKMSKRLSSARWGNDTDSDDPMPPPKRAGRPRKKPLEVGCKGEESETAPPPAKIICKPDAGQLPVNSDQLDST